MRPFQRGALLSFLGLFSLGCQPNYFLIHPLQPVPGIYRETEIFDQGQLRVHWLARYPDRQRPLPAVLVHPDRGSLAPQMEGICLDLARQGYFAAAADYQRLENPKVRNPLVPWKTPEEALASLKHLEAHPRVDPKRIALLGYSKGAILSLQIASLAPEIRSVIAYYPLADFEAWRREEKHSLRWRIYSWFILRQTGKEREVGRGGLDRFWGPSPISLVDKIRAPVLLIHGEKDRTFPVAQSQELCRAFNAAGKSCELLPVPGAGHVFNFLNAEKGEMAWEKTLQFLKEHMGGS